MGEYFSNFWNWLTNNQSSKKQVAPPRKKFQSAVTTKKKLELNRAKMEAEMQRMQNDYLTTSNDNTWVESRNPAVRASRPKNPHLHDRATEGAKAYAAWEKEHPIASAWGNVLGAAPLAVAATPAVAAGGSGLVALGDAAAATAAGQALTSALAPVATAATTSVAGAPLLSWLDAGVTAGFGAHGLNTAIEEGGISPTTALELAPATRILKPIYNTTKNTITNLPKTVPVSNVERRAIEVLLRSSGGKGSGMSFSDIKNSILNNKKHQLGVLKYVISGKGDAKSLVPGDMYTGFRQSIGYDIPSIKLKSDGEKYGDIIDAILYKKQINPEYGIIPSQESLFEFGLTPDAVKKYTEVQKYKVLPQYDNSKGFGNIVPQFQYKDITNKHAPVVYNDYDNLSSRPTSISVATTNRIGADLGHYDMQIGNLNGYPVYRWQDIYEFNPSQYKKTWDLYDNGFGRSSKMETRLKNIFLDRLNKAHTPITIQRNWFSDPFGWPAENYGFALE